MNKPFMVGGIPMNLPIMLGAGVCKDPSALTPYLRDDLVAGALEFGSFTPRLRKVNEGVVQWPETWEEFQTEGFGLNSFRMPNRGFMTVAEELWLLRSSPLPLIVNVAGFSVADYAEGVKIFDPIPTTAAITINLGCPNAHDQKTVPMAYDYESLEELLATLSQMAIRKPIWIKLSPFVTSKKIASIQPRFPHLDFSRTPTVSLGYVEKVLRLIQQYDFIHAVIFSNTLPNVVFTTPEGKTVTSPNNGQAGLSGPIVKEISVKLIRRARAMLWSGIDLIGCGGILTGQDAVDYFKAGACGVQCVSGPAWYPGGGPRFFADFLAESSALQDALTKRMR